MRPDRMIRNHFGIAVASAGFQPALRFSEDAGFVKELDAEDFASLAIPFRDERQPASGEPLSICL